MLKWIFFGIVTGIVALVAYVAIYTGYFRPVTVTEGPAGPFRLIGKMHLGPYHKIVTVIQEVETWAKSLGIPCEKSFGWYIDDPKNNEEIRLQSRGGCVIPADVQLQALVLPEGFSEVTYPAGDFVIAEFEGSPGIGPFKAYPAAMEYIEKKRYAFQGWNVLEIYEIRSGVNEMKTTYYFPLLGGLESLPE